VPDFAAFDQRHYRTVGAAEGYGAWAPTYEANVDDAMDIALLERIDSVDWARVARAADLGCGSGRTAAFLRARGDFPIDGVDVTPAMLDLARRRGDHDRLVEADVRATGFESRAYDLATCVLVDEHLPELGPLYAEARRLLRPEGSFVIVGVHPYFLMAVGMPTHFEDQGGEPIAIETHLHLPSEHMAAARAAGLAAAEMHEALVDDVLVRSKPGWERHRGLPFSSCWVWSAP
jgi:SAM-dependent methyltransferase